MNRRGFIKRLVFGGLGAGGAIAGLRNVRIAPSPSTATARGVETRRRVYTDMRPYHPNCRCAVVPVSEGG